MRGRRFPWWVFILLVVTVPNLFRALSDAIDGLPDWQQNVIASVIVAALLALIPASQWVARRARSHREHRKEHRKRIEPKPLMALLDAQEIEPVARRQFVECLGRMGERHVRLASEIDQWMKRLPQAKQEGHLRREISRQADGLRRYATEITNDVAAMDAARKQFSDAWSSRMYWHDERQTASHILGSRAEVNERLLQSVAANTDRAKRFINDGLRQLSGHTGVMDDAVAVVVRAMESYIRSSVEFEWVCSSVLDFKKSRSGIRGFVHRQGLRRRS